MPFVNTLSGGPAGLYNCHHSQPHAGGNGAASIEELRARHARHGGLPAK